VQTLVWKELNYGKMSEKEKLMLVSEVNILREFNHSHIVKYYDRIIDKEKTKIYIIMEYCEGGDLADLIRRSRRERYVLVAFRDAFCFFCRGSVLTDRESMSSVFIDEDVIWRYFSQVLLALSECHTRPEVTLG
jgi:NIMA (never in mitosis gene a)-related kinase